MTTGGDMDTRTAVTALTSATRRMAEHQDAMRQRSQELADARDQTAQQEADRRNAETVAQQGG